MQQVETKNKTITKRIKLKEIWKNVLVVLQENE